MSPDSTAPSLLEELDARQDDLLDQLDQLNSRIELVITEWSAWRASDDAQVPKAA